MPVTLLDFFREVRHIDTTTRMTIMNNPTSIPISSHAFNPNTEVSLDSPELRSDAIRSCQYIPAEVNVIYKKSLQCTQQIMFQNKAHYWQIPRTMHTTILRKRISNPVKPNSRRKLNFLISFS